MTDVWRSVGKKYCEICKCWYYNNAISANRHHMGGRHRANVAKKLREVGQKNREMSVAEKEQRSMLLQMELGARAAMKAEEAAETSKKAPVRLRGYGVQASNYGSSHPTFSGGSSASSSAGNFAVWFEAVTPQGHIYYWNCTTQKTSWKAPKEGYVTIAAQLQQTARRRAKATTTDATPAAAASGLPVAPPPPSTPCPFPAAPILSRPVETQPSEADTSTFSIPAANASSLPEGPKLEAEENHLPLGHPYGPWQPVEKIEKKEATVGTAEVAQPLEEDHNQDEEDEDLQFGEKKVKLESKAGQSPIEFKKRKAPSASRRHRTSFE